MCFLSLVLVLAFQGLSRFVFFLFLFWVGGVQTSRCIWCYSEHNFGVVDVLSRVY